jgi:hypothetical protein
MNWISAQDREQFRTDGFMVVRGVVPGALTGRAVADITQFLGADLNDPGTWYSGHPVNDGIVPLHHAQSIWDIRQHPDVYAVFAEFWQNPRLMVDINRCCFRPPVHDDWPTVSRGEIHWDADPRGNPLPGLQGIVLLTDVGKDAGGFQCVPAVYRNLPQWLAENAQHADFAFLRPGIAQAEAMQIEGRAGDIILWSTLLPHGPAPNHADRPRIAAFLTLAPPADSARLRSDMHSWWQQKRAPDYWRDMQGLLDPEPGPPAELSLLGRRLIGAEPWPQQDSIQQLSPGVPA